jgi:hypothetical protein
MAAEADLSLPQLTPRQQHAAIVFAGQAAQRVVRAQLRRRGQKLSLTPYAEIAKLSESYLAEHRAELFAQAALSPLVQNLRDTHKRRRPDPQRELLCRTHVQNSATSALTGVPHHKEEAGQ